LKENPSTAKAIRLISIKIAMDDIVKIIRLDNLNFFI